MDFNQTINIDGLDLFPIAASDGVSPQMSIGSMPKRPALLLRIRDSNGCFGWGEVWANFPPRANIHKANIIEDVICPALNGAAFSDPREMQSRLRKKFSIYFLHVGLPHVFEHILAGIDVALWDLALRKHDLTVSDFFGLKQHAVPCYASSINAGDLDELIPVALKRGQRHLKIKIGFQPDGGRGLVERATQLCSEFSSGLSTGLSTGLGSQDSHVMIDANQSWTLEQAKTSLQSLEHYSPFFAEEPMVANAPLSQWEALASATSIPLAGGENIYGVEQFLAMANSGMTVLQPDVAKWGGLTGALELKDALPEGIKLWPHFMGTALGQMASLAVAAIVGGDSMCELDVNRNPLRTGLCGDVMQIQDGKVPLNSAIGLVPEPAPESLIKFQHRQD